MKKLYTFIILIILFTGNLFAGDIDVSSLPKLLGSSNMGKEFYFTFIPAWESASKQDLKLYISSNVKTKVTVEVEGKGYSKTKTTVPNDIIEFTLVPTLGQVYGTYPGVPPEPDQVWRNAGVHVYADDPIICYGVTRYSYTSDGFLALPVNTLGKEYIVASYADNSNNTSQYMPSYTGITAPYDKTKVYFTMGGTASSRTAGGQLPDQTTYWTLNKGDVLLFASLGQNADLSGSKIVATKPVSVVSGNFCAYIPTNCGCCDVIEEMEMPTHAWGQTYHVSPIFGRKKNSMIKIFAKENNTAVYKDHNQIGIIRKAGGIEQDGYLHMRADSTTPRPVVISAEKPISVTQFNSSYWDDTLASDPFQMVLVPVEQYQKEITLNTPGILGGFGFPYNYINLCYESDTSGNIPDDIKIAFYDTKDSMFNWYNLKDTLGKKGIPFANYEFGKQYSSTTFYLRDGVYKLKADKPFQAYSYGWSWADSYGFPASANLKRLDINDTVPPEPSWKLECDGNVNLSHINYVEDKPDNEGDRSNLSLLYMHSDKSYNYKFNADEFMPCEVQTVPWSLEVIDNKQDALAVVTFADCNGNDTTVVIEYPPTKLKVFPNNYDFGIHKINQKSEKLFHFINSDTLHVLINSLLPENGNQGFTLWDSSGVNQLGIELIPPVLIVPLDSFPFIVKFESSLEGEFNETIYARDTCMIISKTKIEASVGTPIIQVSEINFMDLHVTSSQTLNFVIKNSGNVSLKVYDYQGPFLIGKNNGMPIFSSKKLEELKISYDNPVILKPDEKLDIYMKFAPDDNAYYKDSVMFFTNTIKPVNFEYKHDSICYLYGRGYGYVDVHEISKDEATTIYPNPLSEKLHIKTDDKINSIIIYDFLGSIQLCDISINGNTSVLDISNLSNGNYLIKINFTDNYIIKKCIIQK